jgi:hypothetical protein
LTQRVIVSSPRKVDSSCIAKAEFAESEQGHGRILNDSDISASDGCAAHHYAGAKPFQNTSEVDCHGTHRRASIKWNHRGGSA